MIPTGTPASTNHDAIPSGELNSQGNRRLIRVHTPDIAAPPPLKLGFPIPEAGPLSFTPTNHHIKNI